MADAGGSVPHANASQSTSSDDTMFHDFYTEVVLPFIDRVVFRFV